MTKRKKLIIAAIAAFVALAIGLGIHIYTLTQVHRAEIDFTLSDTLPDGGGKKATVILLGGQSNASGCSRDDYLRKNVTPERYAEYEEGYDNVYINYYASATNESRGFVKASVCQGEAGGYFGPELGLAEGLSRLYPNETFYIIKYAWGGTNLYEQWLSPSSRGKTGRLYKQFVSYVQTSIDYLESKNYEVSIVGMCWMQGESDAFSEAHSTDYEVHLSNLIKDVRKEFSRYAPDSGIAFVDAYIAASPAYWVYYEGVNRSKQAVADSSPINTVIDTVSHGLTCHSEPEENPDMAHYDSLSQIKLGNLFAEEIAEFIEAD